ncbi:LOW QUALITY PROTEIN: Integrase catalytic core protein [Phytophthora palmivora]|uniref:Integrase catalytic core protein n=1 Tax=Phytophthora palmivora TaxID=4796 RepID=A0A2P4Y1T8_9STRA|nr:LOW QUALITY PROTEIN: Integrase catalytic core protein [Phytophthora palmivora]
MTSVRDKFMSMKGLKTPVRITIADGTKINAVATGTVSLKLMDGTTIKLSDVLYIPEVEGSLISVSKLVEKNVVAQFSKGKCVFRYGCTKVMEAMRCGNVYKLKTVGDDVCNVATTPRKEPWAVVHALLGHIPFKRYEQLLTMADGVPEVTDGVTSDALCAGCCMGKMRADDFPRYAEKLVKSAGVLVLVHTDLMGPMQTKTPGGCTYVVTFIDDYTRHVTVYFMKAKSDVLSKFKIFKAALENAMGQRIKRLRPDNGGEYTGRQFKAYLNNCGIKHEKTVPYTPQQNGLAEHMNRSLVEMARCMLYHESVDKKWWAEAVNTAAWIINRFPISVTIKIPYEIVYKTKPLLKNLKVFDALVYAHIPDEERRKLDAKAFKCRFMGYEDGVKVFRIMNATTGKVQIVRTVQFMETSTSGHLVVRQDEDEEPAITEDPEEISARKKQIVASSTSGTMKRQRRIQERAMVNEDQLEIENGQVMAAMEGVPKSYEETTTSADAKEWKKAIASELESLTANRTWKLVPRPTHQRPIGCRWVFTLKRNEEGDVIRHKARLMAKGYSQRHGIDYEEMFAPVAYLTSIRFEVEQCDVDTAFLYGKLEEEIYMELPEGLQELLSLTNTEGEGDVVCLLLQSLYGLKQASRVWNKTIDTHLKTMGFKAADADPCVYTRGEGDSECIVGLYMDDMLIASREKDIIASVKAGIAEKFRINDLGRARFILGIEMDYDMERKALPLRAYTESIINRFGQENAKPSLTPFDPSVHLTKADESQSDDDKAKMKSKPYRSLPHAPGMWNSTGHRSVAKLSRYLENPGQRHWDDGIKVVRYLLKSKDVTITYDGRMGIELTAYSDADWVGNCDDRRSVSGVKLMM